MIIFRFFAFLFLTTLFSNAIAQEKHWVIFKDKGAVNFNPYEYFDAKVIKKRESMGIPLVEQTDLPLNPFYCDKISQFAEITVKSRWLNAVSVSLNEHQVREITKLSFVKEVQKMHLVSKAMESYQDIDSVNLRHLHRQLSVLGGDLFAEKEVNGKGIRIAVFDGGFPLVDKLEIFSHLFETNRIIATWDFVNDREFVYDHNSHGTSVLACIAGLLDGERYGLATGAEFLLARTEVNREIFAEEEYWAAAMEWADRKGADIISSSLGYTYHRYFPKQMDGKSVFVTQMANLAARKGMLVINSAGNDGDSDWEVISAPADADSVLSVGAISSEKGFHISFSSYGPTFDGRLKPNVVAFGHVVTTGKNNIKTAYGTSFSAPLISGFAACVMQMFPEWNNMKVFKEIEKSGHLYPYYDYAHGYGVPQASYFMGCEMINEPSFTFDRDHNKLNIELNKGEAQKAVKQCEDREDNYFGYDHNYLYFHIASEETGMIRKYRVVHMTETSRYSIDLDDVRKGEYIMAHYLGYSKTYKF